MKHPAQKFVEDFDLEHCGTDIAGRLKKYNQEFHDGKFYYRDGAWRDNYPLGITARPSNDPLQRQKIIKFFWQLKFNRALHEFNSWKTKYENRARNLNISLSDVPDMIEHLRKLRSKVKRVQLKLQKAQEEMERLAPAPQIMNEIKMERQIQASDFLKRIEAIEI